MEDAEARGDGGPPPTNGGRRGPRSVVVSLSKQPRVSIAEDPPAPAPRITRTSHADTTPLAPPGRAGSRALAPAVEASPPAASIKVSPRMPRGLGPGRASLPSAANETPAVAAPVQPAPSRGGQRGPGPKVEAAQQVPEPRLKKPPATTAPVAPNKPSAAVVRAPEGSQAAAAAPMTELEKLKAKIAAMEGMIKSEERRTVVVQGLPSEVTEQNLLLFFRLA